MIYRILIDIVTHELDDVTQTVHEYPSGTNLRGAFTAGLSEGLDDIPYPHITNPRARFYFTEVGWQKYGRPMYAYACSTQARSYDPRRSAQESGEIADRVPGCLPGCGPSPVSKTFRRPGPIASMTGSR